MRCVWTIAFVFVCLLAAGMLFLGQHALVYGYTEVFTANSVFGGQGLQADALSGFFLVIIAVVGVAATLYSRGYLQMYEGKKTTAEFILHFAALWGLIASMGLVVVTPTAFWFLCAWEAMTLCSFLLIMFEGEKPQIRKAGLVYLVMMHVGFVALVAGFSMGVAPDGTGGFAGLPDYFAANNPLPVAILLLIGFLMKAGAFPLHTWLPEAHPAAPSHVSALMSGVMIKMGIYGALRVVFALSSEFFTLGVILLAVGCVTALWGVILAALQDNLKRLMAYSSIENIGIILIAVGVSLMAWGRGDTFLAVCAMGGALMHILAHAMIKPLLFFGAGNVYSQAHTLSVDRLGGLGKRMPLTAALVLFGSVGICALPPLAGFVSEFFIYFGLVDSIASGGGAVISSIIALAVISLSGGIVMMAFIKLYGVAFQGLPRTDEAARAREASMWQIIPMGLLAGGVIIISAFPSLFSWAVTGLIAKIYDMPGLGGSVQFQIAPALKWVATIGGALVVLTALLALLRKAALRNRPVESGPTWGCGFSDPDAKMQYSGESFSEGLQNIAASLTNTSGEAAPVSKDEVFPAPKGFAVSRRDRIETLFVAWWGEYSGMVLERLERFRTGKVNGYVFTALATLFAILLISLFGWI